MNLIIIEGSGKLETIKKYLGKDFDIMATKGHIRDLPAKKFAVNIQNNFEPEYEIMTDKQDVVKALKAKAAKAAKIYLATDPDREGEAIAWHLAYILGLNINDNIRIVFNEITKTAVNKALENPRPIDIKLVDAQTARRVVDRLVGYKISPIICKKIQPKLSGGRVQSVALKLVVDLEKEILAFVPVEYWTLQAKLFKNSKADLFSSNLAKFNNKKITVANKEEMDVVLTAVKAGKFIVSKVTKAVKKTKPLAPYTTSTMLQDALNRLGFNLKKAGFCAQELYEGVKLGSEGKVALVTYIRSDSVRVAPEAVTMAKNYIINTYGDKYYPEKPNFYASKSLAQDAHEAIRPVNLDRTPESVKQHLTPDNYKMYTLIYNRFLASQMSEATYNSTIVEIDNSNYMFKASGKTPIFDGFQIVYKIEKKEKPKKTENTEDAESDNTEDANDKLPELNEGDVLNLEELIPAQKFTKPPTRYTEVSLIDDMEEKGIGRPATYAPTITTLAFRNYTEKEGKYLKPTELGFKVSELVDNYFSDVINVKFTANMEDDLDKITNTDLKWQSVIADFYGDFEKSLKAAGEDTTTFKIPPKETKEVCDKCGNPMVIRTGRYGEFMACSNFPECKNIKNTKEEKAVAKCPKCGSDVFQKRSKKGTLFYGCKGYPTCDFVSWDIPTGEECPDCKKHLVIKGFGKNKKIKCSDGTCKFEKTLEIKEEE